MESGTCTKRGRKCGVDLDFKCDKRCRLTGKLPLPRLLVAHEVPRTREDEDGVRLVRERGLHVEYQLDVVDTRKVARTRRLGRRLRRQGEGHNIDVRLRKVGVVLVRDDATPVEGRLLAEARRGVEKELGRLDRVAVVDTREVAPVVAALLALTADAEDELQGRVVHRERDAADLLRLGLEVVLRLDDELLKVRGLELVALGLVEEDVRHLELGVEVVGGEAKAGLGVANRNVRARNDNELLELLELDVERHAVVRERRKRQRRTRRKGEPERQRNVEVARLTAVADQFASECSDGP